MISLLPCSIRKVYERTCYLLLAGLLFSAESLAEYDYFEANRSHVRNGVQAVLTCNGLFTSGRSLEQVFSQELAYHGEEMLGTPSGGPYQVHEEQRVVMVGGGIHGPVVAAAFREGIGCVVMPPEATLDEVSTLPELTLAYPPGDPSTTPWPKGDLDALQSPAADVDRKALEQVADWAFQRESEEQVTISLLIVHRGNVILERYAEGFDQTTKTRTWSTAKSIAATLIGMQVDAGKMALDEPLGIDWLPKFAEEKPAAPKALGDKDAVADPRGSITLRHVLNMSSGLYPVDSFGMEYATGSGLAYWAGASSVAGMRDRGLIRTPGTFWDYENYDTLLAVYAFKNSLPDEQSYLEFPRRRLMDKLGMRSTLLSTDRFGDFILSSQVYTNARDLARFGLLYLQDGVWEGERLISSEWIDFVRTPAPAAASRGNDYGGQWWLVPDARKGEVPADAYSTAGNRGQYVIVVPSHDLVIVRRGLDYGRQGFNRWDLTREVLKAIPEKAR
ncbi:MAG: serine hydrolase [Pseudomonadota bacterium]